MLYSGGVQNRDKKVFWIPSTRYHSEYLCTLICSIIYIQYSKFICYSITIITILIHNNHINELCFSCFYFKILCYIIKVHICMYVLYFINVDLCTSSTYSGLFLLNDCENLF